MTLPTALSRSGRRRSPACVIVLVGLAGACIPDLDLPENAEVACADAADCPDGYRCVDERCRQKGLNLAPTVTLLPVARQLGVVSFDVIVADAEADSTTLSARVAIGAAAFAPTTIDGGTIDATPEGVASTLTWNPAAALAAAGLTGYVGGIVLEVTPADAAHAGSAVLSEPFGFGNDPPVVHSVSVDGDVVSGVTLVWLDLSDSAGDPVDLTSFEVSRSGDFSDATLVPLATGPRTSFPGGGILGIETTENRQQVLIAWDSSATAGFDATTAALRVEVTDSLGATSLPRTTSVPLTVDNQPQPRVEGVVAARAELAGGASPIAIHYRIVHALSEPTDIRVEASTDAGMTWQPCNEYVADWSEGRVDLATAPEPGIPHTFVWDATGLSFSTRPLQVRITATDGKNLNAPTVAVPLPMGATPPGMGLNALPVAAAMSTSLGVAGHHPPFVLAADFDADGVTDLATANAHSGNVSVLLGNGTAGSADGTFAAPVFSSAGQSPWAMAAADFDSDTAADVAVVNLESNDLSILLANGDGTFAPGATLPVGIGPWHVTTADFDGDGVADLAVANSSGVVVLLGNGAPGSGDGTFTAQPEMPVGLGVSYVGTADFDDDGVLDLVTTNTSSSNLSVLLGNGDGSFELPNSVAAGGGPWGLVIADFNADAIEDLAVANAYTENVSILLGNGATGIGDGTFSLATDYPVGALPRSIASADLNTDGILDLITADWQSSRVSILLGRGAAGSGDGTFDDAIWYPSLRPAWVLATDLNSDAVIDLAIASMNGDAVEVRLGNGTAGTGDGTFGAESTVPLYNSPYDCEPGDFDGDGDTDLVVVNNTKNAISVLLGDGSGATLAAPAAYTAGDGPTAVAVGDFDGGGTLDLAVTNGGSDDVSILLGDGDGSFSAGGTYAVGLFPFAVVAADLDGDGAIDLMVANADSNTVSVLAGVGDGTFTGPADYAVGINPGVLVLADVNGDAISDLAVANTGGFDVTLLLGQTGGTFQVSPTRIDLPDRPYGLDTGDMNGDGNADLVATHRDSDTVSIHLGDGTGTFFSSGEFFTGDGPVGATVHDFNRDGILDIATALVFTDGVAVLLGTGAGGRGVGIAGPPITFPVGSAPFVIAMAELDGDRLEDLVAVNLESGDVSTLLSVPTDIAIGPGTFSDERRLAVGDTPAGITAGDFDHDGIGDLAVVNTASGDVSILHGAGTAGVGSGVFSSVARLAVGAQPLVVVAVDLNGDGITDLVTADSGDDQLSTILGAGTDGIASGTFAAPQPTAVGIGPCALITADLRGNGAADLVTANLLSNDVTVLLNNGDATFSTSTVTVGTGPAALAQCDLDGDGSQDLVVANGGASSLSVLLNDGAGGLTPSAGSPATGIQPAAVLCRDLDQDGIPDLVTANGGSNTISILRGNGAAGIWAGSFAARVDVPTGSGPVGLVAADVNGDGAIDLLAASADGIAINLGQSAAGIATGNFDAAIGMGAGPGVNSLLATDFNRDGMADLALTHDASGQLGTLLGQLEDFRSFLPRSLAAWGDPGVTDPRTFGLDVVPNGADRFGASLQAAILSQHRDRLDDLLAPVGFVPLTSTWVTHGDRRITGVVIGTEKRVRVESRLGPRWSPASADDFSRVGLDLTAVDPADQRGVVIVLPILEGRPQAVAADVQVARATVDYRRASAVPSDTLVAHPDADRLLPAAGRRIAGVTIDSVALDPDDDLGSGQGARFVIRDNPPRVEVLTDRLGRFRAFVRAP